MSDTVITVIVSSLATLLTTLVVQYVVHRGQTQNAKTQVAVTQETTKSDDFKTILTSIEEMTGAAGSMVTQYHAELLASRKEISEVHTELATVREKAIQTEGRLHDEITARRREGDLHHQITQGLNAQLSAAQSQLSSAQAEIAALTAKVMALEEENRQLRERRRTGDLPPEQPKQEPHP